MKKTTTRDGGHISNAEYRDIRKRFRALLDDVGLPKPWNVWEFAKRLAAHRGRPIEFLPFDMPGGAADAMWVAMPNVDIVIYDRQTSGLHLEQIIAHELSHILFGHRGGNDLAPKNPLDPVLASLLGLDPGTPEPPKILNRQTYSTTEELEAELGATLLWKAAGLRMVEPPRSLDGADAATVDRLAAVMGNAR